MVVCKGNRNTVTEHDNHSFYLDNLIQTEFCNKQRHATNSSHILFLIYQTKKKFPAYLQFLRFSLCRQYIRTCPSRRTVERSESSAANRPEGRESGHNPTASKDSPQVSGEAREEACLVTNSNTSYNKQPKSSLESYSNM